MQDLSPTSVELFVATGCSHCPLVLNELSEQLKKGAIAELKTINIAVDNTRADALNIRSVPWFSLTNNHSYMIFSGNYSPKEIQNWLKKSQNAEGMKDYIEELLSKGELMTITQAINIQPSVLSSVISMLGDEETSMDIRIGLDVLIEQFSTTKILQDYTRELKIIALRDMPRLQIDALHYIALTGNVENKMFLQEQAENTNPQIREAALEALETLNDLID